VITHPKIEEEDDDDDDGEEFVGAIRIRIISHSVSYPEGRSHVAVVVQDDVVDAVAVAVDVDVDVDVDAVAVAVAVAVAGVASIDLRV